MSIIDNLLRRSELFTEDELDTLHRYLSDLDAGKVYGVGINEYMQDRTEENWNKSWVLLGEWYTRAQSRVDRWKIILCVRMLAQNRDCQIPSHNKEILKVVYSMTDDLREGGWLE